MNLRTGIAAAAFNVTPGAPSTERTLQGQREEIRGPHHSATSFTLSKSVCAKDMTISTAPVFWQTGPWRCTSYAVTKLVKSVGRKIRNGNTSPPRALIPEQITVPISDKGRWPQCLAKQKVRRVRNALTRFHHLKNRQTAQKLHALRPYNDWYR